MLDLQAIEAQLAKGDPALKDVYLKLKARLTKEVPKQLPVEKPVLENIEVQADGTLVKTNVVNPLPPVVSEIIEEIKELDANTCSNCSKVCASLAGLKAHERKCKA